MRFMIVLKAIEDTEAPMGEGAQAEIEVRQLYEPEDFGPSNAVQRFRDMEARKN
jgi:hypothetical protein